MKFMVIVKASKASEAGEMPGKELLTDMGNFNEKLAEAGVLLAAEGLHPSSKGARVRFGDTSREVVRGPFSETRLLVAGYWIFECKSLDEAIDWVKQAPNPMPGEEAEIEIRQVFDSADFGEEFTEEIRQQEDRIRAKAEAKARHQ